MSVRPASRPVRLVISQRRVLTTTWRCPNSSEYSPVLSSAPSSSPAPSKTITRAASGRALDVGKIWQAQNSNVGAVESRGNDAVGTSPQRYEMVEKCPDPQCPCAATPDMPWRLPIDRTSKMAMPYYDRHVLIGAKSSGSHSAGGNGDGGHDVHALAERWPSKIESDPTHLQTVLKRQLAPSGEHYRPDFAVSITASTLSTPDESSSSFFSSSSAATAGEDLWLFPDFVRLQTTGPLDGNATSAVAAAINSSTPVQQQTSSSSSSSSSSWKLMPIKRPVVLICGHTARDARCGVMGPVLLREFEAQLAAAGAGAGCQAHVALVSHIGGHKFAGNVVVYMPPTEESTATASATPLDGMGVWYGRVEPRHVEGIVNETLLAGRVIGELLRGVHDFGR